MYTINISADERNWGSQRKLEKQMKPGVLIWFKTNPLVGDILTSRGQLFG